MSASTVARQRGWTIWETVVAMSLLTLALLVFFDVFSSSTRLVRDTRAKHRAEESLRRNLEALVNVVRDGARETFEGFDGEGVSANPTFARVTGADEAGKVYSDVEELRWEPVSAPVPGVAAPGRIVHVRDGVSTLVADRVPSGGFSVWLDGGALVVQVRTYYAVAGHLEVVEGSTSVALRN